MINLKVSSSAAVMALVLAMAAPGTSFAQAVGRGAARGVGVHIGGGGFRSAGAPAARFGGGGDRQHGDRDWHDGHRGDGRFIAGAIAGAAIGGAIASQGYGYYGAPGYYYDNGAVVVAPAGDDAVAYCMQTYPSYDPASGSYLDFDGVRHLCP